MYLSKIEIQGFRLFENFSLKLNQGLNVIVGENNSGKTALIDAIKYVLETNSADWIRIRDEDFYNHQNTFKILLKFEGINTSQAKNFVEHLTHEETGSGVRVSVLYITLKAMKTDTLKREGRYIKTELRSGKNSDGPTIEREIRNYLATTYLKPLRDAEQELAAGKGSRLSQILLKTKELVGNADHVEDIIEEVIQANLKVKNNDGIENARKKIDSDYLTHLIFKSDDLSPYINMLSTKPYEEMDTGERQRALGLILEKLSLTLHEKNYSQGLGYNNVLFMATELLLLEQEKDEFPLLLVEEPEAHLHPQLQNKLLSFIKSKSLSDNNLQCILTTHSPNLASQVPVKNMIIMSNAKAFPLGEADTELNKEDYYFLEKFLDITKSNLFFAKGVLVVEGAAENILLPTIARLIGRPLDDYGVSIISDIGLARFSRIFRRKGLDAIQYREKWIPTKVSCVRDLDLWPIKAEKGVSPHGFKPRIEATNGRGGNISYWLDGTPDQIPNRIRSRSEEIGGQNVAVFISDVWTFEFALIFKGLAEEVYLSIHDSIEGFASLPQDTEERAIAIISQIDKTDCAYHLAEWLERIYRNNPEGLKSRLPGYIVSAIEHVTEEFARAVPASPAAAAPAGGANA